jgi:hypothetical protein
VAVARQCLDWLVRPAYSQSESFRIQDEDPRYRQESKYRFAALIAQTTFEISLWGKATF